MFLAGQEIPLEYAVVLITIAVWWMYYNKSHRVYCLDFAIAKCPPELRVSTKRFSEATCSIKTFTQDSVDFQMKMLDRSGIGEKSSFPRGISDPPDVSMEAAREEFMQVMTSAMDDLFKRTGLTPTDIDILVLNCSLFCPTPSLASMIVHHYKMRKDIKHFNLAGMGCSAGVISVDLAKDLLQVYPNSRAVVFSTENITMNWYFGNDRSKLLTNCLFRCGASAALLSNRSDDAWNAKYELMHTVRVTNCTDEGQNAIFQESDENGVVGVSLSKNLIKEVGITLKKNLTILGPKVLPYSQQLKFAYVQLKKKLGYKVQPFVPNFKTAFDHFCIHAGGRAVIDGLQENLMLTNEDVLASRAVLNRFGNTSSSSIWYELAFHEDNSSIKKNAVIWQIAFGSGIKCNSAVWRACKSINEKQVREQDWDVENITQ